MHKFMRTVGFSMYQKKQDMAKLLKRLVKEAEMTGRLAEQEGSRFCELRTEVAPGMGVAMIGEMSPKGTFSREYYFPYVKNPDVSSEAECSIQRHTERETYAGLLDEYRVGISLIFYMENSMEYRMRRSARQPVQPKGAALTGLAVQGKVLLPVNKTEKQAEDSRQAAKKRSKKAQRNVVHLRRTSGLQYYLQYGPVALNHISVPPERFFPVSFHAPRTIVIPVYVDIPVPLSHL